MMFSVSSYAFAEGDVKKYIAPVSGNREICGFGTEKGKDKLWFSVLVGEVWDNAKCVAECPKAT